MARLHGVRHKGELMKTGSLSVVTVAMCAFGTHGQPINDEPTLAELDAQIKAIVASVQPDMEIKGRLRRAELGVMGVQPARTARDHQLDVDQLLSPREARELPAIATTRLEGIYGVREDWLQRLSPGARTRLDSLLHRRRLGIERVYGPDDRAPLSSNGKPLRVPGAPRRPGAVSPADAHVLAAARATVLLVPSDKLGRLIDGCYSIEVRPYRQWWPTVIFCADAPLLDLPSVRSKCATGFLVGPRRVATARHVISGDNRVAKAANLAAVFDFTLDRLDPAGGIVLIPTERIRFFKPTPIVGDGDSADWCVLELASDAPLCDGSERQPLGLSDAHEAPLHLKVFTVGFPEGAVMTLADDGEILALRDTGFSATLDIFGGNSGGAVIGSDGLVYGLVSSTPGGTWATYKGSYQGNFGIGTTANCRAPMRATADSEVGDTCVGVAHFLAACRGEQ